MRLTLLLTSALGTVMAATLCGCPCQPSTLTYFLVSNPLGEVSESYILPLSNADDIAHARALISDPEGAGSPIAVAHIARSKGDEEVPNWDLLNPPRIWSWHVTEFVGFADFTIEIYDGNPSYVDANLDQWLAETNSTIGFWSYTVTRELSQEEVESGVLN
jgi:hypothetical protein